MDSSSLHDNTFFPQSITDRYAIKRQIGHGGMGNVYLAKDTQLLRYVAIKAIRPEHLNKEDVLKRIDRECKMHAAIGSHPHIVSLFDRIDKSGNIFLIMEYVEGETLADLIKSTRTNTINFSTEFTIPIIVQALSALEAIHDQGVIHRDIKPANIIVGGLDKGMPNAKIMDFGIAKDLEEDETLTKLTMLNSGGPGTPAYMAPERIDAETFGQIVPATDLYAIGIILFELYQKQTPFHGTITEIFSGHLAKQPNITNSPAIPPVIKNILTRALQKCPEKRFQTSQEFASYLKNVDLGFNNETLLNTSVDISTFNSARKDKGFEYIKSALISQTHSKRWWLAFAGLIMLAVTLTASFLLFYPKQTIQESVVSPPPQNSTTQEPISTISTIPLRLKSALPSFSIINSPVPELNKEKKATDAFEERRQKLRDAERKKQQEEERKTQEEAKRLQQYSVRAKPPTNTKSSTALPRQRRDRGDTQSR